MSARTGEDEQQRLRRELYTLRDRVHRLEVGLFRTVLAVGVAAVAIGFVAPFLSATEEAGDGEGESISLLPSILGLGGSGGGPFGEEAVVAATVVGVFALVALATLVAMVRLFGSDVGIRPVRFARICGITLLVLCGIGWLLVFVLAGHWDGRVSTFSPATLAFTIGGAAAVVAAPLHPADWRG
jgi:hypothetical protein